MLMFVAQLFLLADLTVTHPAAGIGEKALPLASDVLRYDARGRVEETDSGFVTDGEELPLGRVAEALDQLFSRRRCVRSISRVGRKT